jgi:hypothetical protein
MLSGPVVAADDGKFSALGGVEAQVLSLEEMQATTGQVNAFDIAAALFAEARTLNRYPRLQDSAMRLAMYYQADAAAINATFARLGLLTPCVTCKK